MYIPRTSAIVSPTVTSAICCPYHRTLKVIERAHGVVCIDAEVPYASVPVERTVEICSCTEGIPLPVVEYHLHVEVALTPALSIHVINGVDTHEVVEVYLVGCLILLLRQVQLVSHLVGEEQSLFSCLLISHSLYTSHCCEQCYHCHYKLLHSVHKFVLL